MIINYQKNGIRFNDKHSIDDWHLVTTDIKIGTPEIKTNYIDIPGSNGSLDLTEFNSEVNYHNREIEFTFFYEDEDYKGHSNSILMEQTLRSYLHGREMDVVLDSDKSFFWRGRTSVSNFEMYNGYVLITITLNAEPYKYDVTFNNDKWLWNPFDFETGIINVTKYEINGTRTIELLNRSMPTSPVITASNAMKVKYKSTLYDVSKGTAKLYDIRLQEGSNELTFIGNGTVEITYQGGVL